MAGLGRGEAGRSARRSCFCGSGRPDLRSAGHRRQESRVARRSGAGGDWVGPVVLYDGECGLCGRTVQFVIRRDPAGRFRFAALQSDFARRALGAAQVAPDLSSVMLVEDGAVFQKSAACFRVLRQLAGPWRFLAAFEVLPRRVLDGLYELVARYRHLVPGPKSCLPPSLYGERFISKDGL